MYMRECYRRLFAVCVLFCIFQTHDFPMCLCQKMKYPKIPEVYPRGPLIWPQNCGYPIVPMVPEPFRMSEDDEDTSRGSSCLQWLSRPRAWWDGDCTDKNELNEDLMTYTKVESHMLKDPESIWHIMALVLNTYLWRKGRFVEYFFDDLRRQCCRPFSWGSGEDSSRINGDYFRSFFEVWIRNKSSLCGSRRRTSKKWYFPIWMQKSSVRSYLDWGVIPNFLNPEDGLQLSYRSSGAESRPWRAGPARDITGQTLWPWQLHRRIT